MPVSAFLLLGWLRVLWDGAPDPAQPKGRGFPAWLRREACSWRGCGSGENVTALGDERGRLPGSVAQQISKAWSRPGDTTPCISKWLIDYVCSLPHLLISCHQQPRSRCFLCPARLYQGFHANFLSTNPNLTLSWEVLTCRFTHLQGSQESGLLFWPAGLGRCGYTKDAPPVAIVPSRWGRGSCFPGIYHSFSLW